MNFPQNPLGKSNIFKKLLLLILFFSPLLWRGAGGEAFSQTEEKTLQAIRVASPPKIDGLLDDEAWTNVPVATDFIQNEPVPGIPSSQKTEVKIVYDNSAIYVGAMLYDHPDSILKELAKRDESFNNADQFSILFDTYNDDLNGFNFMVSAANVQTDIKFLEGGEDEDESWNAVWESKTKIVDSGWIAEMKIPYSALRFPKKEIQEWGLQLMRIIRRHREEAFWAKLDPTSDNFIKQSGKLTDISHIEAPLRLSFTPYISYSVEHYPYNISGKSNYSHSVKGGMDLKYGLNDAFTLDMTLIPDFGQVKSDNKILNLSPFEVEYEERRPFFMEGTELFNKNDLFYSRRIGKMPSGYEDVENQLGENEIVIDNPKETQLYNATKISGRNKHGLGIGFFNAGTAKMYATVKNDSTQEQRKIMTEPLTNYNILVFDKTLKNNSSIGLLNANTTRIDGDRNANVTGLNLRLLNGENTLALNGNGAFGQIFTKNILTNNYENETGFKYTVSLSKISGRFQFDLWENVESDTYDPNDLGLLFSNNEFSNGLELSYQNINPFWKIQKLRVNVGGNYEALYTGMEFSNLQFFGNMFVNFKNYFTNGFNFSLTPVAPIDFYEPRVEGRYFVAQPNIGGTYWYSTDYRKRIAFDGNIGYNWQLENDGTAIWFSIGPRIRISDRMSFNYNFEYNDERNDLGFADIFVDDLETENVLFGKRDVLTIKNSFNTNYIFSPKMYLSLEAYHNWTRVEYLDYFLLAENGYLGENTTGYTPSENNNYNAFNIDFTFSWEFSPGSTMSIVYKNIIENESDILVNKYTDDFSKTLDLPQSNSISIKILYYLDYLKLKRKKK